MRELSTTQLAPMVMIAPGSKKPDDAFWQFVKQQSYRINSCVEQDACVLVNQILTQMVSRSRCSMLLARGKV